MLMINNNPAPPPDLKHVEGKVIVKVDLQGKNWWTFKDGTKIRLERQFENLNRRETEPVNAYVVSAKNIPSGTEILIHPNAPSDTNLITNYKPLSGENADNNIKYYSIPEDQCFAWLQGQTWKPIPPYETALRVFKPYTGNIEGIPPTELKNNLYVTSGKLSGKVVLTVKAAAYEIVFQNIDGREGRLIRFRPFGDSKTKKEEEAIAILEQATEKVENGEWLVGLSVSDCKPIETDVINEMIKQINAYAD
jgi:hypothetical protein